MAMTIDKQQTRAARELYDFDPDATTLTDIGWVDMKDFDYFLCGFRHTIGTSAVVYKIIANPASDGSGTDVVIKTGSAQPDAVGDYCWLETTAEEIADADAATGTARYVSMQVSVATGTDEGVVYYERGGGRKYDALTADSIA